MPHFRNPNNEFVFSPEIDGADLSDAKVKDKPHFENQVLYNDGENIPVVELSGENSGRLSFELLDTIKVKECIYSILTPFTIKNHSYFYKNPADVLIMRNTSDVKGKLLEIVDDKRLILKIFDLFRKKHIENEKNSGIQSAIQDIIKSVTHKYDNEVNAHGKRLRLNLESHSDGIPKQTSYNIFVDYHLYIFNQIKSIISKQLNIAKDSIIVDSNIMCDFGADSLNAIEVIRAIEEKFDIKITDKMCEKIYTVSDLVYLVDSFKFRGQLGKIKWFNNAKGYGFIEAEDGTDVFVHFSAFDKLFNKIAEEGMHVRFEMANGDKGPQATYVCLAEGEGPYGKWIYYV